MDTIKLKGSEQVCGTTANSFANASVVRLLNTNTTVNFLVTQKDSGGTTLGTFTIKAGAETAVWKLPTDTLESNNATDLKGVSVGFSN